MSSRAVRELFLLRVLAVRVLIIWHVMLEDGVTWRVLFAPYVCRRGRGTVEIVNRESTEKKNENNHAF